MPSRRAEREAGPGMLRQQWGFRQVSEYSFRFWVGEGMCLKRLLISFVYLTCWLQRKSLSIKFEFIFLSPEFLSVAFPRAKVYLTGEQPEQKLFSSQVSRQWQPVGMGHFITETPAGSLCRPVSSGQQYSWKPSSQWRRIPRMVCHISASLIL